MVGEVDSHYDYRHRIYSLHMSYDDSTQIVLLEQFCSNLEQLFQKMYFFETGLLGNI